MVVASNIFAKKIFISYAREFEHVAEKIAMTLQMRGHEVFFDQDKLEPGFGYDDRIEDEINASDIFIFLISPQSIEQGSYARTELGYARRRWPNPDGCILPVAISKVKVKEIPTYLQSINILVPKGNAPAEVCTQIDRMSGGDKQEAMMFAGKLAILGLLAGVFIESVLNMTNSNRIDPELMNYIVPGIGLGMIIGYGVWEKLGRDLRLTLATVIIVTLAQIVALGVWKLLGNNLGMGHHHFVNYFIGGAVFGIVVVNGLAFINSRFGSGTSLIPTIGIGGLLWAAAHYSKSAARPQFDIDSSLLFWMVWAAAMAGWIGFLLASSKVRI